MSSFYEYSFIVPVYNAENYIAECIESILRQGERCELILVDDGSTDASGGICDSYAKTCRRVRVFHNQNAGPGNARNFGLAQASGKYVIFVDADDYVSEGLIECFDPGNPVDLIFFNIIKRFPDDRLEPMAEGLEKKNIHGKRINEVWKAISECAKFPASTGGKIIKREILEKNNIRFQEGLIGEDIDWTLQLICNIESADVYTEGNYYYRISPDTRHAYGTAENLRDQLSIIEDWAAWAENRNPYLFSFLAYQYAVLLPFYGALPAQERRPYKKRIKELRYLLSHGKTRKIRLIRLAVILLGINGASKLLYRYVVKRDDVHA